MCVKVNYLTNHKSENMKKTASILALLLTLLSLGSACEHFISGTKICDDFRSVFFEEKVHFSDNLLVCLDEYSESEALLNLQKKNQLKFKKVVEKSYFLVSDIQPSQRSEIQNDFLSNIESANAKFSEPALIHLYSSKIGFATETKLEERNESAVTKRAPEEKVKKGSSLKNDFQNFLDSFKKSDPPKE